MKYEYQDAIVEELLKQKGNEIDKSTLEKAAINVFHYEFGHYKANPEYKPQNDIHISIAQGCIIGVFDLKGSEYSIDFTVYEIDYPVGHKNHILCTLEIV